jgi:DNA-directed RNA polymerase subunit F
MVKAIVNIDEEANKVLNHLKAEYNLKDKSQAINVMAKEFKRFVKLEPEVRPEYIKKLMKIHKGKHIKVGSIEDFRKRYGLK